LYFSTTAANDAAAAPMSNVRYFSSF